MGTTAKTPETIYITIEQVANSYFREFKCGASVTNDKKFHISRPILTTKSFDPKIRNISSIKMEMEGNLSVDDCCFNDCLIQTNVASRSNFCTSPFTSFRLSVKQGKGTDYDKICPLYEPQYNCKGLELPSLKAIYVGFKYLYDIEHK
jgi:hypothetical protein